MLILNAIHITLLPACQRVLTSMEKRASCSMCIPEIATQILELLSIVLSLRVEAYSAYARYLEGTSGID